MSHPRQTQVETRYSALLAMMLLSFVLLSCQPAKVESPAQAAVLDQKGKLVSVIELKTEPFTSEIEVTGTALPLRESFLSSEVPGTIKEIRVKEGDVVKKGQVLVRFDQRGYSLGVKQATAAREAARTQADLMKLELDRMSQLLESSATSQSNYDRVKAQYDGAVAQLQMAESGLEQAQKALSDSVLKAPYDGVIDMILKEIGEYAPSMPLTPLIKIVDASSLEVQAFLPEDAAAHVKKGDKAKITIGYADKETTGEIIFASNRIQQGAQNFEVRLRIDNPTGDIKAGAFCRIRLERNRVDQAILVPVRAVKRDINDKSFVYLAKGEQAQVVFVTLGESQGERVLVNKGLSSGDQLIVSGVDDLKDGQDIQPKQQI